MDRKLEEEKSDQAVVKQRGRKRRYGRQRGVWRER